MKVKIFSVRCDTDGHVLYTDSSDTSNANEHLQQAIQQLFDEHPGIEICDLQFNTTPVIPKTASWNTTNSYIDWEIEKCIIILFKKSS